MPAERPFIATYLMASGRNGTLYVGVTSDLHARVFQHKHGLIEGFTKRYGCTRLVWFERHDAMTSAFQRERNIKRYVRKWKLDLIEAENPDRRDLSDGWFDETANRWLIDPDNP